MKITIVVPVFSCICAAASAQTSIPKTLQELLPARPAAFTKTPLQSQARLLSVTAAGKLYALPQDNMPCLVPDKTTTAVIPNAAPFVIPGNTIRNALPVLPVIPNR